VVIQLRENELLRLLPESIVEMDERGVLEALIGGLQDRVEDQRYYAGKLEACIDSGAVLPELDPTVLSVEMMTTRGVQITRPLTIDETTPPDDYVKGVTENPDLLDWTVEKLGGQGIISPEQVLSIHPKIDSMRSLQTRVIELLAESIGALAVSEADLSLVVQSYFFRLRSKGTGKSFEVLARLIGFSDAIFAPLWATALCRLPNSVGARVNDDDFDRVADILPEFNPDIYSFRDGKFYDFSTEESGAASLEPTSPLRWEALVNGRNPWVKVTASPVVDPAVGYYELAGGTANVAASVAIGAMRVEAVGAGESMNGTVVQISERREGGLALRVLDRLSLVKYRSSMFDLVLVVPMPEVGLPFGCPPSFAPLPSAPAPLLEPDVMRNYSYGRNFAVQVAAVTTWAKLGIIRHSTPRTWKSWRDHRVAATSAKLLVYYGVTHNTSIYTFGPRVVVNTTAGSKSALSRTLAAPYLTGVGGVPLAGPPYYWPLNNVDAEGNVSTFYFKGFKVLDDWWWDPSEGESGLIYSRLASALGSSMPAAGVPHTLLLRVSARRLSGPESTMLETQSQLSMTAGIVL